MKKLYVRSQDQKCGFVDSDNNWVIPARFDDVSMFFGRVAFVKIDKKWGLIDNDGEWIIEPSFTERGPFVDGIAAVKVGRKWGVIDTQGQWPIAPINCNYLHVYSGYVQIDIQDEKKVIKKGILSTKGETVIDAIYRNIEVLDNRSEGHDINKCFWLVYAPVQHKYQILSPQGSPLAEFDDCTYLKDYDKIIALSGKKWGVLNIRGEWVVTPQYDEMMNCHAVDRCLLAVKTNKKWGVIDGDGAWIVDPIYKKVVRTNKFLIAMRSTKWGIIGYDNEWIIKPQFDDVILEGNGLAVKFVSVKVKEKWGLINGNCEWVLKPEYDKIHIYCDYIGAQVGDKILAFTHQGVKIKL